MATLKAIVKSRTRNGMYNVYIRITQNRQFAYVRTSWMDRIPFHHNSKQGTISSMYEGGVQSCQKRIQ